MSTNAQIGFYETKDQAKTIDDFDASILVYWDGYPETAAGVPARIVPFLKKFMKRRGLSDSMYASAWTLHELMAQTVRAHKKNYREQSKEYKKSGIGLADGKDCTGFGILRDVCAVNFFYKVYPNTVEVWKRNYALEKDYGDPHYSVFQIIDLTKKFTIPK